MSAITAYACCCNGGGGQPADCCEFWNNCPPFTPTQVRLSVTYTRTRYYSNGQVLPMETWTYTVQSVGAFTPFGTNCIFLCDYGLRAMQASVSFDHKVFYYTANIFTDATIDGTHGTIGGAGQACSGCVFINGTPICNTNIQYCLYFTNHEYGTGTLTNPDGAVKYTCGRGSNNCSPSGSSVGPRIDVYWPIDEFGGQIPLPNCWYETIIGCCNEDQPVVPSPVTFYPSSFGLIGADGCPDQYTWADPLIDCPKCLGGLFCDPTCVLLPCACVPACNPIPSNYSTSTTGEDAFEWTCTSYYPDPTQPVSVGCSATLTYTERCTASVSVLVT